MDEHKSNASWWQTLPGILTGVAAVLTALGGVFAALHQSGLLTRETPAANAASGPVASSGPKGQASPQTAEVAVAGNASRSTTETTPQSAAQVRAGHYAFKLLKTTLEPYATDAKGKPAKLALRLFIRVTDVMGMSDYVDRQTIRLSADGAELLPENPIDFAVYEHKSAETEVLFIVPADTSSLELLLGRPEDAVGRLPLALPRAGT